MGRKSTDTRFMILYTIVGIIGFTISTLAHYNIPKLCDSNTIRDGLTVVSIISAILTTLGIAYIICNYGFFSAGHDCYHNKRNEETEKVYMTIGLFISVSMMALLLTMGITLNKSNLCQGTKEDADKGKKLTFYIWSLFILFTICSVMSGFGLYWKYQYIPSWAKGEDKGVKTTDKKKRKGGNTFWDAFMKGKDSSDSEDDDED